MIQQTNTIQVQNWIDVGTDKIILDVREAHEVADRKIPGSINIPLGLLPFKKQDLQKDREYIIVCLSGGRSAMACEFLSKEGFTVWNMQGGMSNWNGAIE